MLLFNFRGFVCFIFSLNSDRKETPTDCSHGHLKKHMRLCSYTKRVFSSLLLSSIKVRRYRNSSEFEKKAVGKTKETLLLSHYRKS